MSSEPAPRSNTAIAFIFAGAAVLASLVVFVAQLPLDTRGVFVAAFIGMAVAHVLLARVDLENGTAKTASYFAALGWAILVVVSLVPGLPGLASSSGYLVIAVASVVVGVTVLRSSELQERSRPALVALMAIVALYMASAAFVFIGPLAALLTILFGIAAILTGYFIQTRR